MIGHMAKARLRPRLSVEELAARAHELEQRGLRRKLEQAEARARRLEAIEVAYKASKVRSEDEELAADVVSDLRFWRRLSRETRRAGGGEGAAVWALEQMIHQAEARP